MDEKRHTDKMETFDSDNYDNTKVPNWMKWSATFINRVGFPIFAFCVLAYIVFVKMDQNTKVISELRDVMLSVKVTMDARR